MRRKRKVEASPWSYSKLKAFETCPKQYYHVKVKQDYVEPETEALRYGNEFHKAAEDLIATDTALPKRFSFAMPTLKKLINMGGEKFPELKLGITKDMEPCGFFDDEVWCRGVADLVIQQGVKAKVFDHKTGKSTKYADPDQLELMALSVFAHFPKVKHIKAALLFYVPREIVRREYRREDVPALWAKWLERQERMEAAHEAGVFNPKPSGLCKRHCIVESCEHNGRLT